MSDLDQKRRTVRVLELLSELFEAHMRGDDETFRRVLDEAIELDSFAFAGIRGGITIGEIPNPERDWPLWVEYVAANRDGLAAMEAEDGSDEAAPLECQDCGGAGFDSLMDACAACFGTGRAPQDLGHLTDGDYDG